MAEKMEGAKAVSLVFRIVALALSVAAAVVMGTTSQLIIINSGRGTVVSYSDYSALVYFVVGSVISVFCGARALYLFVHRGGGSLAVSLLDTAALAILFSASGAALVFAAPLLRTRCGSGTFTWRTGTAAAIGMCAAAAVWVAALTMEMPRGGFSLGLGSGGGGSSAGGGGGSACKHGCPSPQC
ncbi:hypothetical protein ACQ4PT_011883 [Festuca glaucescens]